MFIYSEGLQFMCILRYHWMQFVLRGLFRFLPYGGKYHIIFCSLICACETCAVSLVAFCVVWNQVRSQLTKVFNSCFGEKEKVFQLFQIFSNLFLRSSAWMAIQRKMKWEKQSRAHVVSLCCCIHVSWKCRCGLLAKTPVSGSTHAWIMSQSWKQGTPASATSF